MAVSPPETLFLAIRSLNDVSYVEKPLEALERGFPHVWRGTYDA